MSGWSSLNSGLRQKIIAFTPTNDFVVDVGTLTCWIFRLVEIIFLKAGRQKEGSKWRILLVSVEMKWLLAPPPCLPSLQSSQLTKTWRLWSVETGAAVWRYCPSPQAGVGANTQTPSNTNTKLTQGSLSLNANDQTFSRFWLLFKLSHFILISTT